MRGRLQVIAEEMAVSEDEEGEGDEESFVMVSKRPSTFDSSFCMDCGTPTQSGHPSSHRVLPLHSAGVTSSVSV